MANIVDLSNRMVERLFALKLAAGPKVLALPKGCYDVDALADLMLAETIGWYETEADVLHRRREAAQAKLAEILARAPVEYDERTGEPMPEFGPEGVAVKYHAARLADQEQEVRAGLERAQSRETAERLRQVLHEFQLVHGMEDAVRLADDGLLVVVTVAGYGLGANREERLQLRRWYLGLPDDQDWE
jgi:hypothetical protein